MDVIRSTTSSSVSLSASPASPLFAGCVIAVVVLAALCAILAVLYYIIFYSHVECNGRRKGGGNQRRYLYHHDAPFSTVTHDGPNVAGDGRAGGSVGTHIFMFKRS
jgi:hypothetical protein